MKAFKYLHGISMEELKINKKLFSYTGVVGRYDYFTNVVVISMISLFFMLPLGNVIYVNMGSISDIFNSSIFWNNSSVFLKIWVILGMIFVSYLGSVNAIKRLKDILGKIDIYAIIAISVIFCVSNFSYFYNYIFASLITLLMFIIQLCLFLIDGKVTSNLPYDYKREFNWGAFLGTWIWGLFNKSYKTLWMLLISFTPWSFLYALYCGLKGNKWAYKNKNWDSVEKFNEAQEKQTTIFTILCLFVLPLLYFVFVVALVGFVVFAVVNDSKASPNNESKILEKIERSLESFSMLYFEKYSITEDENKFYVKNEDWKTYSFEQKKDILELAASISSNKKREMMKNKDTHSYSYYSKTTELPKTKIYSFETNQLLGEFVFDENKFYEKGFNFQTIKSLINSYKFYSPNL